MAVGNPARILPMKTAGTQHLIERVYRESGPHQWVREALINAFEADATRVEYGIEWQAVETLGVYRRVIADDGCGMTAEQLVEFFNTFGGGGKPIGDEHANFGVGAKTSLLPWNKYGLVVLSWVDGEASMIWVQQDPSMGEYGLRLVRAVDPETGMETLDEVYQPYEDARHGCDWSQVKPSWIEGHGTLLVLLGNEPGDDTIMGDASRNEADIKGISAYLNRRMWTIPDGVQVHVDEVRTSDRTGWPPSEKVAHGPIPPRGAVDRRTNRRGIRGARHYIHYPDAKGGRLAVAGTVQLRDKTEVDWYLWEGERPRIDSYAAIGGYVAALYRNELYDISTHHSTYRTFGVVEQSIRSRLWLIVRPPEFDDATKQGVYPKTDRNSLLLRGGPDAGGPLPMNDWAGEFAEAMPAELVEAIQAARGGRTGTLDETWRERLAERFGIRWRIPKLRVKASGTESVDPALSGTMPRATRARRDIRPTWRKGGHGGTQGATTLGTKPGDLPAVRAKVAGGIPSFRTVPANDLPHGMLAAWQPNDPEFPEGVVLLNREHPILLAEVEHWQGQFADIHAEAIREDVIDAYGQIAVAKVAHSEQLKGLLPSKTVDDDLRSEAALTMALIGLMAEEAVIAPRVGGKYRKRRWSA
jgi:hypothetical protein